LYSTPLSIGALFRIRIRIDETDLQIFMNILAPTLVCFVLVQYVVQLDPDPDPHRKALVATWIRIHTYSMGIGGALVATWIRTHTDGHWWLPGSGIDGCLDPALMATWIWIHIDRHWMLPGSRIGGYLDSDPHRWSLVAAWIRH
jgi:hypothetical protein